MSTSLTFNYAHSWTDISKGADQNGAFYEVTYVIMGDWQKDGDTAVNELVGFTSGPPGAASYIPAHQYPLSPNLLCVSAVVVDGFGAPNLNAQGYPSYTNGGFLVKARYQAMPWSPYGAADPSNLQGIDPATLIPYCTQNLDFECSTQGVPGLAGWKWNLTGAPVTTPMQLRSWSTVMDLTFHTVPYLNSPLIRSLRGSINEDVFLGGSQYCVLFRGARTKLTLQAGGNYAREIQLVFVENNNSWNQVINPATGKLDTLLSPTSTGLYPTADLTPLLSFSPRSFF